MENSDDRTREILDKYKKRIKEEFNETIDQNDQNSDSNKDDNIKTWEYKQFKSENLPTHFTLYEKACNFTETLIKLTPDKKYDKFLLGIIN